MDRAEESIRRRFEKDCNWTTGRCYFFAIILKDVFPSREGHFIYRLSGKFYDWTGCREYTKNDIDNFYNWATLASWDPLLHKRLERDCIK
jgi:hypothetical protein